MSGLWAAALALAGCANEGTVPPGVATVESTTASCAPYADLPDAHGYCLARRVTSLRGLDEMEGLCARAGGWEEACRAAWVSEQERLRIDWPPETLLRACGSNDDCAFQVVDTRFGGDVLDAIERCATWVREYEQDCVGHALDRWLEERRPDDGEAARVLAGAPRYAALVGYYVGAADACFGTARCAEGRTPADDACRAARDERRADPRRCPVR